ncbi:hypothetical protein LOZ03_003568 [Ophidiomyces ophidiicola]|nr:hypothetical protein LOZ03_003568 [Ophidiomyces ophidiicola]
MKRSSLHLHPTGTPILTYSIFYFYLAKNSSTMRSQLLPVLLVAAAPLIQAAATPNAANAITELAHSDLKEHDGNGFLNCVRSTNTDYHMYVDEGTMVVTRSPGQDIDLEEHDAPSKIHDDCSRECKWQEPASPSQYSSFRRLLRLA